MNDNGAEPGARGRSWIDLSDQADVDYWIDTLNVTEEQLRAAVEKVGIDAMAVCRELGR